MAAAVARCPAVTFDAVVGLEGQTVPGPEATEAGALSLREIAPSAAGGSPGQPWVCRSRSSGTRDPQPARRMSAKTSARRIGGLGRDRTCDQGIMSPPL